MSAEQPDLQCQKVVELVTDYLEHALSVEDRSQLEQHLVICGPCRVFVDQHTTLVRALSALATPAPEAPDTDAASARTLALAAFRRLRGKGDP